MTDGRLDDTPEEEPEPEVEPGWEVIPLDLSKVPTEEVGYEDAKIRYQAFIEIAKDALGSGEDKALFREHLPFMSFINRASSLHAGIVATVKAANPHSAYTLLRAYLELVVTVLYLDSHPEYLEALERPMRDLPKGTRKQFAELFRFAAREMRGIRTVYAHLNEMAHFGSAAMWAPFTVGDEDEKTLTLHFGTGPSWRKPEDARTALAMLQENDEAMLEVLARYASHHVLPHVVAYENRERIRIAFASVGAKADDDPRSVGILTAELQRAAIEAGLFTYCQEHDAYEISEGVTGEVVEAWAAEQLRRADSQVAADGAQPEADEAGGTTAA